MAGSFIGLCALRNLEFTELARKDSELSDQESQGCRALTLASPVDRHHPLSMRAIDIVVVGREDHRENHHQTVKDIHVFAWTPQGFESGVCRPVEVGGWERLAGLGRAFIPISIPTTTCLVSRAPGKSPRLLRISGDSRLPRADET